MVDIKALKVKSDGGSNKLYLYGDIVSDGAWAWDDTSMYPDAVRHFLDGVKGDIELHINSPGGSTFAAAAIVNLLRQHEGKTTAYIDGWAASAASVIALSCDEVVMPANSYLMIHHAWCDVAGNASELRQTADLLDSVDAGMITVYENKMADGVTRDDVVKLMDEETYFSAEEAAKVFKVTVTDKLNVAAYANGKTLERAPEACKKAAQYAEAVQAERLALENLRKKKVQ